MRSLRLTAGLMVLAALTQCSTKSTQTPSSDIRGHWHLVKPDTGTFETLDIEDSICYWDKYDLDHGYYDYSLRYHPISRKEALPSQDEGWTSRFYLDGDTLNIGFDSLHLDKYVRPDNYWDSTFYVKYVRSDLRKCLVRDRFGYYFNPVPQLPQANRSIPYDTLADKYHFLNLMIGFFEESVESPNIVFGDTYITRSDFKTLWERTLDASGSKSPVIVLFVDKRVSIEFVDEVTKSFPAGPKFYQAFVGDGDIGLKLIRE